MALIQDLNSITGFNGSDIIIVDDGTETQTGTITQLTSYLSANLSIPTGIDDITGLQTALDGKAPLVHTHQISDVIDLQTELNTKFDSTTAGVVNNVVIIGNGSVDVLGLINERVADITGVSPTDARIPGNVTSGNFLQFSGTDGTIGEVTSTQFKADLDLNNVDNTADLNKPVSTAQAAADDLRVLQTAYDTKQTEQDNAIAQNTVKIGITNDQASAILTNTAKRTYPEADETKLSGIESGADVTDTTNVWSSLGISTEGRTNYALSERGVYVQIPDSAGNTTQLLESVTTEQVSITSGGGMVVFNIEGVSNNNFTATIVNTSPANWITDASLDATTGTIGTDGTATITATVPSFSDLSGTRSFQLQVQVEGAFQPALTSDVVTQYTASQLITGISLSAISFGNAGVVEAITVSGIATEGYSLELFDVTPAGWITSGALSATTGVIGMDGTDSSNTISIPSANDDTVSRSFRLRARATDDTAVFVETATITQVHTQSSAAGNLVANAGAIVNGGVIDWTVNVTQGDSPFQIVLNQNATDSTVNPLFTVSTDVVNTDDVTAFIEEGGVNYNWSNDFGTEAQMYIFRIADTSLGFTTGDFANLSVSGQTVMASVTVTSDDVEFLYMSPQFFNALQAASSTGTISMTWGNANVEIFRTSNFEYTIPDGVSGEQTYYVHISDNDGDIVVEMETLTLTNDPPSGNISQTMGATSPAIGDTVEFTSAFTDAEGDALTYQWQHSTYDNSGPFENKGTIDDTSNGGAADQGGVIRNPVGSVFTLRIPAPSSGTYFIAFWSTSDHSGPPDHIVTGVASSVGDSTVYSTDFFVGPPLTDEVEMFLIDGKVGYNSGKAWNISHDEYELQLVSNAFTDIGAGNDLSGTTTVGTYDGTLGNFAEPDNSGNTGPSFTDNNVVCYVADGGSDDTGGEVGDVLVWAGNGTDESSVIAIFADGADHSTATPVIVFWEASQSSASDTWNPDENGYYETRIDTDIVTAASANAQFTQTNAFGATFYGFDASRVEIWVGNQYTDATVPRSPGTETNATYSFRAHNAIDISTATTVYSEYSQTQGPSSSTSLVAASASSDLNGSALVMSNGTNQNAWGALSVTTEPSTIAVWNDGEDHSTIDPSLILVDGAGASGTSTFQTSNFFSLSGTSVSGYQAGGGHIDISIMGSTADRTGVSINGTFDYFGFDSDRVEIWYGDGDIEQAGFYRVAVTAATGDTTTVFSNAIEIT